MSTLSKTNMKRRRWKYLFKLVDKDIDIQKLDDSFRNFSKKWSKNPTVWIKTMQNLKYFLNNILVDILDYIYM